MKVVEIFKSIEGEGVRAGLPTTFIRLFGCNLNCTYCDTQYACSEEAAIDKQCKDDSVWEKNAKNYKTMSIQQIIYKVLQLGVPSVTITGGEPMIHEGFIKLVDVLLLYGYHVNVETNGTVGVPRQYENEMSVFFTMDYKCPSSGVGKGYKTYSHQSLRAWDVLKFVVGSEEDLDKVVEVLDELDSDPIVYISPVFGAIEPLAIVEYMQKHKLYNCRLQLQLHKIIWDPNERGV